MLVYDQDCIVAFNSGSKQKQQQGVKFIYPKIADIRKGIGVTGIVYVDNNVHDIGLLEISQRLCLIFRSKFLYLQWAEGL